MIMAFLRNQKSKTPYVVVEITVLLLVIFFSFKGMITFHSYYGSPCIPLSQHEGEKEQEKEQVGLNRVFLLVFLWSEHKSLKSNKI